jgi:hypothetical protein
VYPRSAALVVGLSLLLCAFLGAEDKPSRPGPTARGFVLPNGWTITPAGRQVTLTDLPLTDGKHVLVATSGFNKHELSLIELESGRVVDRQTVRQSWYGLAASPDQKQLWWAGGEYMRKHGWSGDVDRRIAFITSANFTEAAQTWNIEIGSFIRCERFAARLIGHFETLVDAGLLKRLDFA